MDPFTDLMNAERNKARRGERCSIGFTNCEFPDAQEREQNKTYLRLTK